MIAENTLVVIGVDTHKHIHTAVFVDHLGKKIKTMQVRTITSQFKALLTQAKKYGGDRVWAVEGTGSYGASLTRFLVKNGEHVNEVGRPSRIRGAGKTDEIDALSAARRALNGELNAKPRGLTDQTEQIRKILVTRELLVTQQTQLINQLKALIIAAPLPLKEKLDGLTSKQLLAKISHLKPSCDIHQLDLLPMKTTVKQIKLTKTQADHLQTQLHQLVQQLTPDLLNQQGINTITAARIIITYSYHGRVKNEAAFAKIAGTAPQPASSGQTTRHRLSRTGDRKLNCAIYRITLTRLSCDQQTKTYMQNQLAQGKTKKEAIRKLKRYIARQIYNTLKNNPNLHPQPNT